MTSPSWTEVAAGVFTRHFEPLELNVGLIVGSQECLIIDTGADVQQGQQLAALVREVTDLPWQVLNTHAHFDHCFGNGAFADVPRWGQRGMVEWLRRYGTDHRRMIVRALLATGMDDLAERVSRVSIVPPDHLVDERASIDLGDRRVHFLYAGRGHSSHDLVVAVPDASLVFWGDLVEVGADPEFDDGYPLEWAGTLSRLLDTVEVGMSRIAIPGHGDPAGRDQVEELHDRLDRLARHLVEALERRPNRARLVEELARTGFSSDTLEQVAARVLPGRKHR